MSGGAFSQAQDQATQSPAQQEQKQADKARPEPVEGSVRPASDQPPQTPPEPKEKDEIKITPRQAEELFHSVDEILDFDSKQTGLPIKREVKRKLTSRDEVVSY